MLIIPAVMFCQPSVEIHVLNSSGADYKGSTFSISYSIGETITGMITCPEIKLIQGFIQPAGKQKVSVDFEEYSINIIAFPNPASNILNLKITGKDKKYPDDFSISIVNILGEIVYSKPKVETDLYSIDFTRFTSGTYYVLIGNKLITKKLKIVKM